jgi:hypothetical protein
VKASLKATQTDALKICMIQRGLTVESLALAGGVKQITISNQIAKSFPSRRLRLVMEGVLNLPIWSNMAAFESRQQLASRCGFDPFVLTAWELQQRSAALKIRGRSKSRCRAALIGLIEKHFIQPTHDVAPQKPPITIHRNEQHPIPKTI